MARIVGMYGVRVKGQGVGRPYRDNSYNLQAEQFYRRFSVEDIIEVEKGLTAEQERGLLKSLKYEEISVCFGGRRDAVIEEEIALMTSGDSLEISGNVQLNEDRHGGLYVGSMSVHEVKALKGK